MGERQDSQLKDGRDVAIHHAGSPAPGAPVLVMHYGTPHTGKHPPPIDQLAAAVGLRLVSVTRPGFAGSSRRAGRTVSDTAEDIIEVLDRLNVGRMVTAGYSGGGPHALALAALAPDRVDHAATFGCPNEPLASARGAPGPASSTSPIASSTCSPSTSPLTAHRQGSLAPRG